MSILFDKYNTEEKTDECWYSSSNVYYSKMYDKENDYKDLEVVFSDGRSYLYKGLNIQDYLLFKNGGLDNSQGKALNKFIKKYSFEKLEKKDISVLENAKNLLIESKKEVNNDEK